MADDVYDERECEPKELDWIGHDSATQLLVPLAPAEQLWFDLHRNVVVEGSHFDAIRTRGHVHLGELVGVTAVADRRLVAGLQHRPDNWYADPKAATRAPDELLLLGFDDPDAPKVLARASVPGDIAFVTFIADASSSRVYAVAEEFDGQCVQSTKQSRLYAFAVEDDEFRKLGSVELGDGVTHVARVGDYILLVDNPYARATWSGESSARLVSLTTEGVPEVSDRADPPALEYHQAIAAMTVASDTLAVVADGLQYLRYDVSEFPRLSLLSSCER